jgi:hypothetical protein
MKRNARAPDPIKRQKKQAHEQHRNSVTLHAIIQKLRLLKTPGTLLFQF